MENTPNAAAAPATEATPNTNSNAPAETTITEPAHQPDQFDSFVEANGGRDKVLEKMKQAIGDPKGYARTILKDELEQMKQATAPVTPPDQQPAQANQVQALTQPQIPEGGMTQEEFMTQQYFSSLANQSKYASIQDEIRNGEVLKVLKQYDIPPMVNGAFNAKKVEGFLDLYAKTKQPAAPSEPITTTPTVNYAQIDGEIDSQQKAMQVMGQGQGHPQYEAAVKFMREKLYPSKALRPSTEQK